MKLPMGFGKMLHVGSESGAEIPLISRSLLSGGVEAASWATAR
jgi:hypothetical protein